VRLIITSRLKAERRGEKGVKKGGLSYENDDSIANGNGIE
jgi:hypothetical protein